MSATELLHARVRDVLVARFPDAAVTSLAALEGGHSGHTLVAELTGTETQRVVVKAGAPGRPATGRHDVLRQARVLQAVGGRPGVAVPEVLATDDGDPQVFLMTMEPGQTVEPVLDGVGDLSPARVAARAGAVARMLGRLHAVPVADTPLRDDVPLTVRDELARWTRTIGAVDPTLVVGADELVTRLAATVPDAAAPSVVHGDYRLGNILCEGDEPTGIIDWEIWSVTDPRIDLGWLLLFCDTEAFPGISFPAPGMATVGEMLATYESVAGPVADAAWFLAFARLKMAAIMGHNLKRHREGRYHDPYQERLPPTIASMVARGLEVTEGSAR